VSKVYRKHALNGVKSIPDILSEACKKYAKGDAIEANVEACQKVMPEANVEACQKQCRKNSVIFTPTHLETKLSRQHPHNAPDFFYPKTFP
jgi:hypothetical protein